MIEILYAGLKEPKEFKDMLSAFQDAVSAGEQENFLIRDTEGVEWENGTKFLKGMQRLFEPVEQTIEPKELPERPWVVAERKRTEELEKDSGLDGIVLTAVAEGNRSFEFAGILEGGTWNVYFFEFDYNYVKEGVSFFTDGEDYDGELELLTEEGYCAETNLLIEGFEGSADELVDAIKTKFEPFIEMRNLLDNRMKECFPGTQI